MKMTVTRTIDRIALLLFHVSIAALAFGYGVAVVEYHIFPYRWLAAAKRAHQAILSDREPGHRHHYLFPAWYEYSGARVHDANSVAPGVTLLTSYWRTFDWKPGIQLIDSTGQVLHQWKTDPAEIWPTSPHTDYIARSENMAKNYVHGCFLFNNGDVVFNIEYMGLVRMNARGQVLWKLPYRTHHSVSRDESGNFWVCGLKWLENTSKGRGRLAHYPGLVAPLAEDFALKVSEDGEILREISILKALYQGGYQHLIWRGEERPGGDILHANDVEQLRSDMADQYPLI